MIPAGQRVWSFSLRKSSSNESPLANLADSSANSNHCKKESNKTKPRLACHFSVNYPGPFQRKARLMQIPTSI
jgi:hypothetical protein